jgi:hypothetical protein
MSHKERSDIPNWMLTSGEKIQALAEKVPLDWLIKPLVGSASPAYIQAVWHKVDQVADPVTQENSELPIAKGDPTASMIAVVSRFKKQAAVLGSHIHELDNILEEYRARPVVAYTYDEQTRVGVLPRGIFDLPMPIGSMYYTAAIRMGRNDVGAGIGAWLPEERVFLKPHDAVIKAQNVPISELGERFPDTPLV